MARFAASSYCEQIYETSKFECKWGCGGSVNGSLFVSASKDTITTGAGLVVVNHSLKQIVLSFRGTYTWRDIVVDLLIWKSVADWKSKLEYILPDQLLPTNLKIHAGFELLYIRLREPLISSLLELSQRYLDYEITFTGHSMGGAIATLAAVDFQNRFGMADRINLYTFGTPRIGDSNWARYVNQLPFSSRMFRFDVVGDPVSILPLQVAGYEHSLQQYSVQIDGSIVQCKNQGETGESEECWKGLVSLRPARHYGYFGGTRCTDDY